VPAISPADTVQFSITNKTGACTCLPDSLPEGLFDPATQTWQSVTSSTCEGNCGYSFHCDGTNYQMAAICGGGPDGSVVFTPVAVSCDPFFAVWDVSMPASAGCGGGSGTFRIVVTIV
jgi:hypothetical protein